MRTYHLLLPLLLLLGACQGPAPRPDYDPGRNFAAYRSWSWQEPGLQFQPNDPRLRSDLTAQRIRGAIAEQLEQRDLRPAARGVAADLRVQAWWIVDRRQEQISTQIGGAWGDPWRGGFWGGPGHVQTRTLDYQVATLQIDLFDAGDGTLVWRGSAEQLLDRQDATPQARAATIQALVARILSQYPPH